MTIICGIDPGIHGGAAALERHGISGRVLDAITLPTCADGANQQIDVAALCAWIEKTAPDMAAIENVQPMPSIPDATGNRRSMGAVSAFRFGLAVGQIRAAFVAYQIPVTLIHPQSWKRYFKLKGPDKEQSRQLALSLHPEAAPFLTRKLDHGRAEALLIARFRCSQLGLV